MSAVLSAGLVVVATALLVLGLLIDDGLALVGLSIAVSVAAGGGLVVVYRRNRQGQGTVVSDG